MIGFDPGAGGTPESDWSLTDIATTSLPGPTDQVLVLAAHPDDETLGVGGLLAACDRLGVRVSVVAASDGDASHPHSPTHTPAQLATIRRAELRNAVALLAPDVTVQFLGLPDGELTRCQEQLRTQLAELATTATLIVSPWSADRHPDHEVCARVAAEVATKVGSRHWQYPIWAWHWADPDSEDLPRAALRRLPLTSADRIAKAAALDAHVSQHSPLSDAAGDEAILSPSMLAHFARPDEYVIVQTDAGAATGADASGAGYFDALYAISPDPWGLETRFYEHRKRAMTLAALPRARFRRAFEPGCATGLGTEELARRCDEVVAWDVAERPLELARQRLRTVDNVRLAVGRIPDEWPGGEFDLIVLSEVGYYCRDLEQLVQRVLNSLSQDGCVLACHWRHPAPDHPHTAEAVHAAIDAQLHAQTTVLDADFLLQVWTRSAESIAQNDGVIA